MGGFGSGPSGGGRLHVEAYRSLDINRLNREPLVVTGTVTALTKSADGNGTDLTRFNALRHGILSRYTVLPWEDAGFHVAMRAGAIRVSPHLYNTQEQIVEFSKILADL